MSTRSTTPAPHRIGTTRGRDMTATLIPPTPSPLLRPPAGTVLPSGARWAPVTETLWAGTRDGEFLGTVEFVDGGFETTDEHGVRIGRSHSLLAAQRLVD